jgi:hypothetical protein
MAEPIKLGLTLYGEDAASFLEMMFKPLTKEQLKYREDLEKMFKDKEHLFRFDD